MTQYNLQLSPGPWFATPGNFAIWSKGLGFRGYIQPSTEDWLGIYTDVPSGNTINGVGVDGLGTCGKNVNRVNVQVLTGEHTGRMHVIASQQIYTPGARFYKAFWGLSVPGPAVIAIQVNGRAYTGSVPPMAQTPAVLLWVNIFGVGYE